MNINAKLIVAGFLLVSAISTVSYISVSAYTYLTTTTIDEVREQMDALETAKSTLLQLRNEYCHDHRLEWSGCEGAIKTELSSSGNSNSGKILDNAKASTAGVIAVPSQLDSLHTQLCKKQINSPICKDQALFDRLYRITEERIPGKQFFPILLGMTNSESSLGLDMAKDRVWGLCHGRNNWWGAKYQIKDDNTREYKRELNWFSYKYPIDQFWCNLYPFETIEEYWTSKVNWIRYWYKGCIDSKTPLSCISVHYVWSVKVVKPQWVRNASIFLK